MPNVSKIVEVSEATFERDVVQKSHEVPVVVDFWAAWCGPCRMLGPVLERLATEPGSSFLLAKVDVDANPGLAMRFGVSGIPAVKAFRNGKIAGEFVGAQPEPRVRQFIRQIAPGEAELAYEAAEELAAARRWDDAEKRFRQILAADPAHPTARLGLARALIGQGKGCEARPILEELLNVPVALAAAERLLPVADFLCLISNGHQEEGVELTPVEAQYRQAGQLLARGKVPAALDGLLEVLRHNKRYREGKAKDVMLGVFELLGDRDPLTNEYRRELASVLF